MKFSILVVDDLPDHLHTWCYLAEKAGFNPIPVSSAEEAMKVVNEAPVPAAIVDLCLSPEDDPDNPTADLASIHLIRAIREANPSAQIIALTVAASDQQGLRALRAGANDFASALWKAIQLEGYLQKRLHLCRMILEEAESFVS